MTAPTPRLLFLVGALSLTLVACQQSNAAVTNFEDCAAQGNPIMESYPRQCRAPDGQTFTEEIDAPAQEQANITVGEPMDNQEVGLPLIIRGHARVFENTLNCRLTSANGTVLAESFVTAHAPDIGQFGSYQVELSYSDPQAPTGTLEVFSYSAKDGAQINTVTIPVRFAPNVEATTPQPRVN